MQPKELLHNGIQQLNLKLTAQVQNTLLDYVSLLCKWNKTYNLTSIRDSKEIIIRHILDSLAIVPHIKGKRILDVGTGAGFPGIPLALALPNKHFTLLDSNNKKIRFLNFAVITLGIKNIEIVQDRIENFKPEQLFDCITTRAFASLAKIINKTKHLRGDLLAMKGKYPKKELQEIQEHVIVHSLKIPFLEEQRHLVYIKEN